ncbi:MAG: hypothetical protein LBV02_06565 [Bacteroidales bacterium]|jgi:hypothetical protein|nr:hypothetical protein [Bacteroidales bacterium]
MRKIIIFFLALSIISCFNSGKKFEVDSYADSIMAYQNKALVQIDTFFQSLFYPDYNTVDCYQKAVNQLKISHLHLTELGDFKNDEQLYDEGLNYLHSIDNLLSSQGKKLLELHEFRDSYGNFSWRREMDSLWRASYLIINAGQQDFDSVLVLFLDNHGFNMIIDTALTSKSNFENLPQYFQ